MEPCTASTPVQVFETRRRGWPLTKSVWVERQLSLVGSKLEYTRPSRSLRSKPDRGVTFEAAGAMLGRLAASNNMNVGAPSAFCLTLRLKTASRRDSNEIRLAFRDEQELVKWQGALVAAGARLAYVYTPPLSSSPSSSKDTPCSSSSEVRP